jgi:insulysin
MENISKSIYDKSIYQSILLDNGLRVIYIYDNDVQMSSAFMRVNVGYGEDEIDGQAHLLEHMLFNGTERFPEENQFSKYVTEQNGYSNAYTANDHTCYYFEVANNKILESLDMFGEFFINPSLKSESISREMNAVDSEHKKNLLNDFLIEYNVLKQVVNPKNTFNKFGTGCEETLSVPDIDKKIKTFFNEKYSSNLMTLGIISNISIDELHEHTKNIFSKIKNNNYEKYKCKETYFNNSININLIPINDNHNINFYWQLPSTNNYKYPTIDFISHLLGNEVNGTIYNVLYNKNYIKSLSSGPLDKNNDYMIFSISVGLTDNGLNHINEIKETIYDYVNLIKNNLDNLEYLYNEILEQKRFNLTYFVKTDSVNRVSKLVNIYNEYDIEIKDLIQYNLNLEKWQLSVKDLCSKQLSYINDNNCITILKTKTHNFNDYLTLKYYPICKYTIENDIIINKSIISNIDKLYLPEKNNYISYETKIIEDDFDEPVIIRNENNNWINYWLPCKKFNKPNTNIILSLVSSNIFNASIKDKVILYLYMSYIIKHYNDQLYLFELANYHVNINFSDLITYGKIIVSINGNCGKIGEIFRKTIDMIFNNIELNNNMFESIKEHLINTYKNNKNKQPYQLLDKFFMEQNLESVITDHIMIEYLDEIKFKELNEIKEKYLDNLYAYVQILICGNTSFEEANDISNYIEKYKINPISNYNINFTKPINTDKIYEKELDNIHDNNAYSNYILLHNSDINSLDDYYTHLAITNVIDNMLSSEYFDELRTKECFGYIVSSHTKNISFYSNLNSDKVKINKELYYNFTIQSPNKSTDEMIERTSTFIYNYYEILKQKRNEDIKNCISSILEELNAEFKNINEMTNYIWSNIQIDNFIDSKQVMNKKYESISLDTILEFYENNFINRLSQIIITKN